MNYAVEYLTCKNSESSKSVTFSSVDEALKFVKDIKESCKDSLEWVFIHCVKIA